MSNSLGVLTLDLVAQMGGWVKGFTQAEKATKSETRKMQRSIRDVEKSVQSMHNSLKATAGLIGITLTARALDGWIRGSLQAAASTGDFAKRIGATTEELTALRYMATQSGASVSDLDGSMLRLNSRLGADFISGGPAAKSLELLKIRSEDIINLPLEEKIRTIGDALQGLDRGVQLRHLQNMAGDSARSLVEMFNLSKEQMDEITERAQKLGYVISSDLADSAGEVLAQIDDIKGAFSNLSLQILSDNLPAIEDFFSSITADDIEAVMGVAKIAVDNFGDAIKSLAFAYGTVLVGKTTLATVAIIKSTNAKIRDIAVTKMQEGVIKSSAFAMARKTVAANALRISMGAFGGPLGIATLAALSFLAFSSSSKQAALSADELDAKLLELEQTMGSMTANQLVYARRQLIDQLEEEEKALKEYEKEYKRHTDAIQVLKDAYEIPNRMASDAAIDRNMEAEIRAQEVFAAKIDSTKQNIDKLNGGLEDTATHLKIITNTASGLGDGLSREFEKLAAKIDDETARIGLTSRTAVFDYEVKLGVKYAGLSSTEIDDLRAKHEEYDNELKKHNSTRSGGINLLDAYTDKLVSLSDETAKLISLNDQLSTTGYESQYNSVASIRHEIESQNSALSKLSETQQGILLLKAQELDAQKQINEILVLGHDYNQNIDDLMFEAETYGLMRKEVEKLTFYRDLDTQAKLISIGMSEENIAALEKEIERIKELYDLYQKQVEGDENDPIAGIRKGINDYIDTFGSLRDQMADFTQSTLDQMGDALADFVTTGKLDFADLTRSILADLAKMMIKMAIVNAMKSMMSGYAEGGLVGPSFSSGGFTGVGGKYEEAGIVHKNEYVFSKKAVQNLGASNLERLHQAGKSGKQIIQGYSEGGLVGHKKQYQEADYLPIQAPRNLSMSNFENKQSELPEVNITIIQNEDGSIETEMFNQFGKKMDEKIKVTVKKEIANQRRDGGSLAR